MIWLDVRCLFPSRQLSKHLISSANTLAPSREGQRLPHGHLPDVEIVLADVSGGPLGNELVHRVAVVGDLPGDLEVLVELPCHGQKKRRLTRARRPEQQRHPPGLDDPADVVEDGHGLLPAGDDVERVPDGLEHTEQSTDLDIEKGHGSSNGVACGGRWRWRNEVDAHAMRSAECRRAARPMRQHRVPWCGGRTIPWRGRGCGGGGPR